MKQLFLMRHATAEIAQQNQQDIDRKLTDQGILEATAMGMWLQQKHYFPDLVLCSVAQRTKETNQMVLAQLQQSHPQIQLLDSLYDARLGDFLKALQPLSETVENILLIAHNPGLEHLLQYLTDAPSTQNLGLSPATVACLAIKQSWDKLENGDADLIELVRPGQIS